MGLDPSEPAPVSFPSGSSSPERFNAGQPTPSSLTIAATGAALLSATPRQEEQPATRSREPRKQVSLQRRTLGEQILSGRQERALARWAEQQAHWEAFRDLAAEKTGRGKEELVVTRAEEHRERLEIMEMLERATPEEAKCGGRSWYHSLRGKSTPFIQIGNMFSGLYLPVKLDKESYVHEIVRKPLLKELAESRQEVDGKRKGPRTWRNDEYLVARLRRYRHKIMEIAPGKLDLDEVLEPQVVSLKPALPGLPSEPNEYEESCLGEAVPFVDNSSASVASVVVLAAAPEEPAFVDGPHFEVYPDKLQFTGNVNTLCTRSVRLKNVGTAFVAYEWVLSRPVHGFQESILPDDQTVRFTCHVATGTILPGEETHTLFTFTSATAGAFTCGWRLRTSPELLEPLRELPMHGVALEGDRLLERRQAFRQQLAAQQLLHGVQELLEDVVEAVRLGPPQPLDLTRPRVQERLFEEANAARGLYWSPHAWDTFSAIDQKVQCQQHMFMPKPPAPARVAGTSRMETAHQRGRRPIEKPPPPPAGSDHARRTAAAIAHVPSAVHLADELSKLKERNATAVAARELAVDLARAERAARERPLERSPLYWLAYETVLDIAGAVPARWNATRRVSDLPPLPFIAPPDDGAPASVMAEHAVRIDQRQALRADPDRETEAKNKFVELFGRDRFGPTVGEFAALAAETSAVTRMQTGGSLSLRDRFQPYLHLQSAESVEMSGNVVLLELDLVFLVPHLKQSGPWHPGTDPPMIVLTDELQEQAQTSLRAVNSLLESNPLAVLIMGHLGVPVPDAPGSDLVGTAEHRASPTLTVTDETASLAALGVAAAARMASLPSLEPLTEILREVITRSGVPVEFVPHQAWLGDAAGFAERARADGGDGRVFLLENMSAFPEELGVHRTVAAGKEVEGGQASSVALRVVRLPWASREAFAQRIFRNVQPEFLVQDSLAASCHTFTSHAGLWLGAPQRVVGPTVEAELNAFIEALQLPFGSAGRPDGPDVEASEDAVAAGAAALSGGPSGAGLISLAQDSEESQVPAPLLAVIGGGGFGGREGEERLLKKLELLLGVAHLAHYEKDGLIIALGGELALCVLTTLLDVKLGLGHALSTALSKAVKEALIAVFRLGATVSVPLDFVCEEVSLDPTHASSPVPPGKEETFQVAQALAAQAYISLGHFEGVEQRLSVDAARGLLTLQSPHEDTVSAEPTGAEGSQQLPPGNETGVEPGAEVEAEVPPPQTPLAGVPPGWAVRDMGALTLETLRTLMRRSRGVLWNGALGVWEEERWQSGTRAFLAAVESRLQGDEDDEDEEEEDEGGDDGDEEKEEEPEGALGADAGKSSKGPRVDFETAVVIGEDSARLLPALLESHLNLSFVSRSGEGLLALLRGAELPGLLACGAAASGR